MFTRTLQTIQNSTTLIASFTIDGVHQEFEIRRLNVEREHYIVLTKQSLARKHLWEDVKIVTEVFPATANPLRYSTKDCSSAVEYETDSSL